ncbi:MAG: DUF2970 domain-containing protein [Ketobacteraceae bacterium]|nr:DUF2970 domain-containing protein [Ketobacteraceae bacterium]
MNDDNRNSSKTDNSETKGASQNGSNDEQEQEQEKISFLSMIQSVVAGIFGVQSDKNRQKDFRKGDASQFIVLGIVATLILMITMIMIVRSVLESAGQ